MILGLLKEMPVIVLFVVLVFFGTLFFGISVILKYSVKKKLSKDDKKELTKLYKKIKESKTSNKEKIIDFDTLYHKILKKLGYEGTFGEILKKEPNEVGDLQKVWDLHKTRNSLVHDFDKNLDISLEKKVSDYEKQIRFILDIKK